MLRRLRIGLGLLLLAGSILFLAWGYWPAHRELRVRPVSFPSGLVLPEEYRLTLLFPARIRVGEAAVVKLTFGPATPGNSSPTQEDGKPAPGSSSASMFDTHEVTAEARFDIPGIHVRPSELISAPISRGQTAVFYWTLRPAAAGGYRGTIWLYLRAVDRLTGVESRETVSAQLVEMEAVKLLGLTVNQVRVAGMAGLVIGLILSMPLFSVILGGFLSKRGGNQIK